MVKIPTFLGVITINLTKGYLQEEKSSPTQICGKEEMQQDFLTSFVIYSPFQKLHGWHVKEWHRN